MAVAPLDHPFVAEEPVATMVRVIVGPDGEVEELDGRAGLALLERYPVLGEYGRALLATGRDAVRFSWIAPDDGCWYAVRAEVVPGWADACRVQLALGPVAPPFDLTPRELDVLTLLAGGIGNRDISARLGAAVRTITTHVERILVKLDQSSRAGAASVAVDLGLLRLPVPGGGRSVAALTVGLIDVAIAASRPLPTTPDRRPVARRPILLGTVVPVSGFAHVDGLEMLRGTRLAIDEINARGGVLGRNVELRVADADIRDKDAVVAAFAQLAAQDVDAVTSGYTAVQTATDDAAADYGAPYLHAATREAAVERVRDDRSRYRNVFHVCPTDVHYGPGFVRFIDALAASGQWQPRHRRLAVVTSGWPELDIGLDALRSRAEQRGWDVSLVEDTPVVVADWRPLVERIAAAEVDALFLGHFFPEAHTGFQRAFLQTPSDTLVYALYGPSVPSFVEELGGAANGVLWATVSGSYSDDVARRFAARFRLRYGEAPGRSHAGIAYDRVNMLAAAWARAQNPRSFDRVGEELRRAVHRGVNGAYYLDNPGQCGLAYPDQTSDPSIGCAHLVFQVQAGRHAILSPAPYADSTFVLPPWFGRGVTGSRLPPTSRNDG